MKEDPVLYLNGDEDGDHEDDDDVDDDNCNIENFKVASQLL